MNNDLISREGLKKHKVYSEERHEYIVPVYNIDNAPTVDLKDIYQEGYYDGHLNGYTKAINEGGAKMKREVENE